MAELNTLARPYAKAAFEFAQSQQQLTQWSAALGLLAAVSQDGTVRQLLQQPQLTADAKAGLLIDVCGDQLDAQSQNFVRTVAENNRIDLFPAIAEILAPKNHPIRTKRICVDTRYFETFNRPNVALVDLRATGIERITATGIRTTAGEHDFDSLVLATGFDAMTGTLNRIAITGRDGEALRDKWAAGPRTLLGLMSAGFPNLFLVTGPGSPSVLSNMIVSIEQHVDWIADCLDHMRARGVARIEATAQAEDDWVAHVNEVAQGTLYPQANSWYMGANIPGKPQIFMPYIGGVGAYREKCAEIAAQGYPGFRLAAGAQATAAAAE